MLFKWTLSLTYFAYPFGLRPSGLTPVGAPPVWGSASLFPNRA